MTNIATDSLVHPHPASNKESDFVTLCNNSGINDFPVVESFRIRNFGELLVEFFDMPEVGDGLNKHVHGKDYAHISIVTKGRIKAFSHDWEKIIEQGQLVDFKVGQPHGMVALEPNTQVINVRKHTFAKQEV